MKRRCISISALGAGLLLLAVGYGTAWADSQEGSYVGIDECLTCHEEMERPFNTNVHSKTAYFDQGENACEECHGPGSVHAESDGDKPIGTPATLPPAEGSAVCLRCHDGNLAQRYWWGSSHEANDVSCASCHSIHSNFDRSLAKRTEAATCFECHPEQRSNLFKRSTHPMRDMTRRDTAGKMSCSSCHNPHGSQSDKLIDANSVNDKCYECHQEKQAPVLWEHSPVKESCLNCHEPHGSNHDKLLTLKRPRLCQQCHEAGRHQTVAGEPTTFLVMNRGCSNCHAQVHGSNHPAGVKLKR